MYWFRILTISVVLLVTYAKKTRVGKEENGLPEDCGLTLHTNPDDVLKQNTTSVGQFPWIARIGQKERFSGVMVFYCAASLIHRKIVATAAHCGDRGSIVRLGEFNTKTAKDCDECHVCSGPPQDIRTAGVVTADHCRVSRVNDFELVILEKPAELNDYVKPICFPHPTFSIKDLAGETTLVPGWGAVYSGWGFVKQTMFESSRIVLSYVKTEMLDASECNDAFTRDLDQKTEYCVGYKEGGKDPCIADSGSPLIAFIHVGKVKRAVLIGIASQGLDKCAEDNLRPFIYTAASSHREFLDKEISNNPDKYKI